MVIEGGLRHRSKICFDRINHNALIYKALALKCMLRQGPRKNLS